MFYDSSTTTEGIANLPISQVFFIDAKLILVASILVIDYLYILKWNKEDENLRDSSSKMVFY